METIGNTTHECARHCSAILPLVAGRLDPHMCVLPRFCLERLYPYRRPLRNREGTECSTRPDLHTLVVRDLQRRQKYVRLQLALEECRHPATKPSEESFIRPVPKRWNIGRPKIKSVLGKLRRLSSSATPLELSYLHGRGLCHWHCLRLRRREAH